jgi:hypothetical protein
MCCKYCGSRANCNIMNAPLTLSSMLSSYSVSMYWPHTHELRPRWGDGNTAGITSSSFAMSATAFGLGISTSTCHSQTTTINSHTRVFTHAKQLYGRRRALTFHRLFCLATSSTLLQRESNVTCWPHATPVINGITHEFRSRFHLLLFLNNAHLHVR